MPTALVDVPAPKSERPVTRERSIEEIISSARQKSSGVKGAIFPAALSGLLLWCCFTPLDFGPLAWLALVPLLQLVRVPRLGLRNYVAIWFGGCLFAFPALQWMRLGDPTMYIAWFALAAYVALDFPVFVGLTRIAHWKSNVPLWVSAPVVWTGLEFLRAHLMTGFAWYFLGHSQYRWPAIVQISDLCGAYGVSFLVMLVNAAVAMFVPMSWLASCGLLGSENRPAAPSTRSLMTAVVTAAVALGGAWIYGAVRLNQSAFQEGPRIALIQGNFPTSVKHDPNAWDDIYSKHHAMSALTVSHQPDVIVWPESMFRDPLFIADRRMSDDDLRNAIPDLPVDRWRDGRVSNMLRQFAEKTNAALVIGIDALIAGDHRYDHFNSAVFVTPDKGLTDRYDKLHRVPFGEYIPLRDVLPFLQALTPFGDEFGIAAGKAVHVFTQNKTRMLPLICFEDTVPHLVRSMAQVSRDEGPIDVFVNLTNDGWFHGSSELDQHLITASFRCIENRTPMVRAVNTGISAFIDGNGQVREPETIIDLDWMLVHDRPQRTSIRDPNTGHFYKQWNAAFIAPVPLDPRGSLYAITGDWFAASCAAACVLLLILSVYGRLMRPSTIVVTSEE
jgi:apolipoprotein N-acyltransferase